MNISDGISVQGATVEDHDNNQLKILKRLHVSGICLVRNKIILKQPRLLFHGHVLSRNRVLLNLVKVKVISQLQELTSVPVLQFHSDVKLLYQVYSAYASLGSPLLSLIRKNTAWKWGTEERSAFENIRPALSTTCVLPYFDPKLKIPIITDEESDAVSAVLA